MEEIAPGESRLAAQSFNVGDKTTKSAPAPETILSTARLRNSAKTSWPNLFIQ
jgi:hypothetical protein